MMMRYTFHQEQAAERIEGAVKRVLAEGVRTADIYSAGLPQSRDAGNGRGGGRGARPPLAERKSRMATLRVGFIGWRGMVGSVLLERMRAERDFDLIEPVFFTTSQAGGEGAGDRQGSPAAARMHAT